MENLADPDRPRGLHRGDRDLRHGHRRAARRLPGRGRPACAPGDQVLAVDGTSTLGESVSSLVYEVRGEAGTDVTLTIRRVTTRSSTSRSPARSSSSRR